jgi:hypothetical protein
MSERALGSLTNKSESEDLSLHSRFWFCTAYCLVAPVAVFVAVLEALAEVTLVEFLVTQT